MKRVIIVFAALAFGCANSNDKGDDSLGGTSKDGGGDDASLGDESGGLGEDDAMIGIDSATMGEISADAFWADDPPPKMCGDSGVAPVVPGGTPECPDDKNREGCACPKEGATASCWPGFRKNRNRGICKDGTTTCKRKDETNLVWGPCEGYVLPSGTTGKEACTCFSGGGWKIANLSPCFFSDSTGVMGAVSTVPTYDSTGAVTAVKCPASFAKPSTPWSKTTLNVDCAGHFKLCFTIKAGNSMAPAATDCVVTKQCVEGDYTTTGKEQPFGELPAWINTDATCSKQFNAIGGYGEMSVEGTSVECDPVNKVFNRVPFCPSKCNDPAHAMDADCKSCSSGGGGSF
ncbi:MAG: hypothetical protein ACXWUG_16555 [Polyangiales bacterium]